MIKAFDIKSNEVNSFPNHRASFTASSAGTNVAKTSKNTKIAKKPVLPWPKTHLNAITKPKHSNNVTPSKRTYKWNLKHESVAIMPSNIQRRKGMFIPG